MEMEGLPGTLVSAFVTPNASGSPDASLSDSASVSMPAFDRARQSFLRRSTTHGQPNRIRGREASSPCAATSGGYTHSATKSLALLRSRKQIHHSHALRSSQESELLSDDDSCDGHDDGDGGPYHDTLSVSRTSTNISPTNRGNLQSSSSSSSSSPSPSSSQLRNVTQTPQVLLEREWQKKKKLNKENERIAQMRRDVHSSETNACAMRPMPWSEATKCTSPRRVTSRAHPSRQSHNVAAEDQQREQTDGAVIRGTDKAPLRSLAEELANRASCLRFISSTGSPLLSKESKEVICKGAVASRLRRAFVTTLLAATTAQSGSSGTKSTVRTTEEFKGGDHRTPTAWALLFLTALEKFASNGLSSPTTTKPIGGGGGSGGSDSSDTTDGFELLLSNEEDKETVSAFLAAQASNPWELPRTTTAASGGDGFEWPVLEMAEYEFGDDFGAGGAREVKLEHAVIIFFGRCVLSCARNCDEVRSGEGESPSSGFSTLLASVASDLVKCLICETPKSVYAPLRPSSKERCHKYNSGSSHEALDSGLVGLDHKDGCGHRLPGREEEEEEEVACWAFVEMGSEGAAAVLVQLLEGGLDFSALNGPSNVTARHFRHYQEGYALPPSLEHDDGLSIISSSSSSSSSSWCAATVDQERFEEEKEEGNEQTLSPLSTVRQLQRRQRPGQQSGELDSTTATATATTTTTSSSSSVSGHNQQRLPRASPINTDVGTALESDDEQKQQNQPQLIEIDAGLASESLTPPSASTSPMSKTLQAATTAWPTTTPAESEHRSPNGGDCDTDERKAMKSVVDTEQWSQAVSAFRGDAWDTRLKPLEDALLRAVSTLQGSLPLAEPEHREECRTLQERIDALEAAITRTYAQIATDSLTEASATHLEDDDPDSELADDAVSSPYRARHSAAPSYPPLLRQLVEREVPASCLGHLVQPRDTALDSESTEDSRAHATSEAAVDMVALSLAEKLILCQPHGGRSSISSTSSSSGSRSSSNAKNCREEKLQSQQQQLSSMRNEDESTANNKNCADSVEVVDIEQRSAATKSNSGAMGGGGSDDLRAYRFSSCLASERVRSTALLRRLRVTERARSRLAKEVLSQRAAAGVAARAAAARAAAAEAETAEAWEDAAAAEAELTAKVRVSEERISRLERYLNDAEQSERAAKEEAFFAQQQRLNAQRACQDRVERETQSRLDALHQLDSRATEIADLRDQLSELRRQLNQTAQLPLRQRIHGDLVSSSDGGTTSRERAGGRRGRRLTEEVKEGDRKEEDAYDDLVGENNDEEHDLWGSRRVPAASVALSSNTDRLVKDWLRLIANLGRGRRQGGEPLLLASDIRRVIGGEELTALLSTISEQQQQQQQQQQILHSTAPDEHQMRSAAVGNVTSDIAEEGGAADADDEDAVLVFLGHVETGLRAVASIVSEAKETRAVRQREAMARRREKERDEKLCVVCQDLPKETLLMPCRHLCVCRSCSLHDALDRCPVCRTPIQDRMNVFT